MIAVRRSFNGSSDFGGFAECPVNICRTFGPGDGLRLSLNPLIDHRQHCWLKTDHNLSLLAGGRAS